jgi:hypothetical protein
MVKFLIAENGAGEPNKLRLSNSFMDTGSSVATCLFIISIAFFVNKSASPITGRGLAEKRRLGRLLEKSIFTHRYQLSSLAAASQPQIQSFGAVSRK